MIQSNIRLYILLFRTNDPRPKVLIANNTKDIPSGEIGPEQPVSQSIKKICDDVGIAYQEDLFKIADCQIYNDSINVCYYYILPFGYSNPLLSFVDMIDLDISAFPHLQKIINLL